MNIAAGPKGRTKIVFGMHDTDTDSYAKSIFTVCIAWLDAEGVHDSLQIRGVAPDAPNPGKVGEGIAQNINGPDPKGAASEVCHMSCLHQVNQ